MLINNIITENIEGYSKTLYRNAQSIIETPKVEKYQLDNSNPKVFSSLISLTLFLTWILFRHRKTGIIGRMTYNITEENNS